MAQPSLLLTGVLLLNNFVVAQHIGLRPVRTVDEAIGLGAATALALWLAAPLDWLLTHFLFEPAGLDVLRTLSAVLLIAALAQISQACLRSRQPRFFPGRGDFLPLIITNGVLLALAVARGGAIGFAETLARAVSYGFGFALLLVAFQALRERCAAADAPQPFRGAALDVISAGLVAVACCGLAGLL